MNNKEVKVGDRIKLVHTQDKFTQLKPGDLGTVWDISIFNIERDGKPDETGIQSSLTDDDMKHYLGQVIEEIKKGRPNPNNRNG